MNRRALVGGAVALVMATSALLAREVSARCTYAFDYPAASGPRTYMMASATRATVTATADPAHGRRPDTVPAQIMRVDQVAGYRSEVLRGGLRRSGQSAVFVRYHVGATCEQYAAPDGAFDSAGTSGLYVGFPRPADRWIEGRPTFDITYAGHYPLPQWLRGRTGGGATPVYDKPTMTAAELFAMYRALWTETLIPGDSLLGSRIARWIAQNPRAARKAPAEDVVRGTFWRALEAEAGRHAVPLGGTYAITFTLAGVDSAVVYARTWRKPQVGQADYTVDSATGIPIGVKPTFFQIVMTMSASMRPFTASGSHGDICGNLPIAVSVLPVPLGRDSTWSGELPPTHLSGCGESSSPLLREWGRTVNQAALGELRVTFRKHADGRVTFEGRGLEPHQRGVLVRGQRVSTVQEDSR